MLFNKGRNQEVNKSLNSQNFSFLNEGDMIYNPGLTLSTRVVSKSVFVAGIAQGWQEN